MFHVKHDDEKQSKKDSTAEKSVVLSELEMNRKRSVRKQDYERTIGGGGGGGAMGPPGPRRKVMMGAEPPSAGPAGGSGGLGPAGGAEPSGGLGPIILQ